jgi:DNA-binding NarL/FixJ family response regulator
VSGPIHSLIVHNQVFFGECLAAALAADGRRAAVAGDVPAALDQVRRQPPDLVLADWRLPAKGALDLTAAVHRQWPDTKVLVLGVEETPDVVWACVEAGAAGYVPDTDSLDQFRARVEQVLRGETFSSPGIARALFARLADLARARERNGDGAAPAPDVLTCRELQILRMIADGLSNKQIAARLNLSLHTVKNHIHNLLEKLAVEGRYAAVQYAREQQWLAR